VGGNDGGRVPPDICEIAVEAEQVCGDQEESEVFGAAGAVRVKSCYLVCVVWYSVFSGKLKFLNAFAMLIAAAALQSPVFLSPFCHPNV
jgi:hypothetical protein